MSQAQYHLLIVIRVKSWHFNLIDFQGVLRPLCGPIPMEKVLELQKKYHAEVTLNESGLVATWNQIQGLSRKQDDMLQELEKFRREVANALDVTRREFEEERSKLQALISRQSPSRYQSPSRQSPTRYQSPSRREDGAAAVDRVDHKDNEDVEYFKTPARPVSRYGRK